jgi:hypothetical protein
VRARTHHEALIALSLTLAGCILPSGHRVEPIPGGAVVVSPNMPDRGLKRKRVVAKQEPDLLLAEDGTSCRVKKDRYREVEVGTDQLCGWQ